MPQSNQLDLTVVVTTHAEGRLLRPTLRSVAAAIEALDGSTAELLIVRDNADTATRQESDRWAARDDLRFEVRIIDVELGESGASRNAGAQNAIGEFVAFVDGDDLVSDTYFTGALRMLRAANGPLIVHPEYIVSFGARSLLWRAESARTHEIDYRDLVRHNVWPSSAVTSRAVYVAHPYRSLPPDAGYGPEDWIWNIDTSAAGVPHDVIPETVFFYRVRERGGVNNRHAVSILPSFDLEGLKRHLPLQAVTVKSRGGLLAVLDKTYKTIRPIASVATSWLSHDARRLLYQSARWTARTVTGRSGRARREELDEFLRCALLAASELDPSISWTAARFDELPLWSSRDDGYTEIIERVLAALETGGAIVAVPWIGVGGADLVAANYARALNSSPRFSGRTVILGTYLESRTRTESLPDGVPYIHIDEKWLHFRPHIRQRLIAQLVVLARPELVVSVNSFHVTDAMRAHAPQMTDGTKIYSTLFAFDRIGDGYPVNPITDDSHRDYLDVMDGLITDNSNTARLISDILALPEDKILVHRQPAASADETSRAAAEDDSFSDEHPFRIVWPHRLDEEKRPDAVVAIAQELRRRNVPASIDVWGQKVLSAAGDSLLRDLKAAGVNYRGPYSGGLSSLEVGEYHCLLLTSKSEGLPLVLVQALQVGLPVVASHVGGVPDIILDGETGLLANGPDDTTGFADAIQLLMNDIALRRRLIERGKGFVTEQHSWDAYQQRIENVFG